MLSDMNDGFAQRDEFGVPPILEAELAKDEKLLWSGKPRVGRAFLTSLPILLFAVPWTAFALFWIATASGMGRGMPGAGPQGVSLIFPLFGLPFVLIGLAMMTAPIWIARRTARTLYAVTDRRAILLEPAGFGGGYSVTSIRPADMQRTRKVVRGDGSGDLILSESMTLYHNRRPTTRRIGFFAVERVSEVERLMQSIGRDPRR